MDFNYNISNIDNLNALKEKSTKVSFDNIFPGYKEQRQKIEQASQARNNMYADTLESASHIHISGGYAHNQTSPEIECALQEIYKFLSSDGDAEGSVMIGGINLLDVMSRCIKEVDSQAEPRAERLVQLGDSVATIKFSNLRFHIPDLLYLVCDLISFSSNFSESNAVDLIIKAITTFLSVLRSVSVQLTALEAKIILTMYENTSQQYMPKSELVGLIIARYPNYTEEEILDSIDKLQKYKCIATNAQDVWVCESLA